MKKYLTLATAALLMAACSEKPGYTISGTVANADLNGKYVYLYEYGAKDAAPLDSALIANGQFSLTGSQDSPRLCELKVNTGDAGEQGYQTVFVLENGQLQARMDAKGSAVSGTAEKVRTEEEHRPVARRAAAHKKACAAAGPYPEVRTTLFIIGSVRRGYALQRRESSCRPT